MNIEDLIKTRNFADGWCTATLWGVARTFPNGVFGEIGFRCGGSALAFAIAAREVGGKVYSIDKYPCEEGRQRVADAGYADIHNFILGDSAVMDFPEKLDVLFIDGNHTYQDVRLDYKRHYGRVKQGGVIFFHDPVSCEGVRKFVTVERIPFLPYGAGLAMEVVGWTPESPCWPSVQVDRSRG